MDSPIVYDKAKYHWESVNEEGLPDGQEFVHTGFYLGWLIENDLLDSEFVEEFLETEIKEFQKRKITGPKIYELCDGALVDDMLTDEGNEFSQYYFDFEKGSFVSDYMKVFNVSGGKDFYGVKDSWGNYDKIKVCFDSAYSDWKRKKNKRFWEFWK